MARANSVIDEAEQALSTKLSGGPRVVIFNRGWSALSHALGACFNKKRESFLSSGDGILIPASCWSTIAPSVARLGLRPILVDVQLLTANIEYDACVQALNSSASDIKAIIAYNVVGNASNMTQLETFAKENGLIFIEVARCAPGLSFTDPVTESSGNVSLGKEGLGAKQQQYSLEKAAVSATGNKGVAGDFGVFAFDLCDEDDWGSDDGGVVLCKSDVDAAFLRSTRGSGWTAYGNNGGADEDGQKVAARGPGLAAFAMPNAGIDARPTKEQAEAVKALIANLDAINECSRRNAEAFAATLLSVLSSLKTKNDDREHKGSAAGGKGAAEAAAAFSLLQACEGVRPSWSSTCFILGREYAHHKNELVDYLNDAIARHVKQPDAASASASAQARAPASDFVSVRPLFDSPFVAEAMPRLRGCPCRFDDCPAAIALSSRALVIRGPRDAVVSQDVIEAIASALSSFDFRPRKCVLVTGAGGMLGRHVKDVLAQDPDYSDCDGVFVARHDGDLRSKLDVDRMFARYQPTHVLHCAGMRDSIHGMNSRLVDFWLGNVAMNDNVLRASHEVQAHVGARIKVVSILSTVMFPRDCEYPMTAEADRLYGGRHHAAAESYAAAKKALAQLAQWYRMQHSDAFTSVLPGNFYGQYGDFNPSTAPLVNALIARAEKARSEGTSDLPLKVMGTGNPLRQVQHARDLARACLWALDNYDEFDPLIVAGEEVSVRRTAELVCEATGYRGGLAFEEGTVDGPLRRTADTSRYCALCPENKDLDLLEGIKRTVEWYREKQAGGDGSAISATAAAGSEPAATAFAQVSLVGPGKADQQRAPPSTAATTHAPRG